MIYFIEGKGMSKQSFIKLVVIESRAHVVDDEDIIIFAHFILSSWLVSRVTASDESYVECLWVWILSGFSFRSS